MFLAPAATVESALSMPGNSGQFASESLPHDATRYPAPTGLLHASQLHCMRSRLLVTPREAPTTHGVSRESTG